MKWRAGNYDICIPYSNKTGTASVLMPQYDDWYEKICSTSGLPWVIAMNGRIFLTCFPSKWQYWRDAYRFRDYNDHGMLGMRPRIIFDRSIIDTSQRWGLTWQTLLRKLLVWQRMFAGTHVTPRTQNGGNFMCKWATITVVVVHLRV